jgi:hypothetical protein
VHREASRALARDAHARLGCAALSGSFLVHSLDPPYFFLVSLMTTFSSA